MIRPDQPLPDYMLDPPDEPDEPEDEAGDYSWTESYEDSDDDRVNFPEHY